MRSFEKKRKKKKRKSAVNFISKSAHPQKVILAGKIAFFARDIIISMATGKMERSDWLRAQIVVTCRCILHDILLRHPFSIDRTASKLD